MSLSEEWVNTELSNSEFEVLHRAPDVEYSFYNSVKTGDMDAVIENCKQDAFMNLEGAGILSQNPLTNIKYHFVVTTAMITRYCIDGGLEALTFIMKWQKILPAKWFFLRKVQFSQNLLCNV